MPEAVDLNNQLRIVTGEIGIILANRYLPAKVKPERLERSK